MSDVEAIDLESVSTRSELLMEIERLTAEVDWLEFKISVIHDVQEKIDLMEFKRDALRSKRG